MEPSTWWPRGKPQASTGARPPGNNVTDCPPFPDGCGQVRACPLGHCQAAAGPIPAAARQRPRGPPSGDVTSAGWGRCFPAPPRLRGARGPGFGVGPGHRGSQGRQRWGRRPAGPRVGAPHPRGASREGGAVAQWHRPRGGSVTALALADPPWDLRHCAVRSRMDPGPRLEAQRGGAPRQAQTPPGLLLPRRPARPAPGGRRPHIPVPPEPPGLAQGPERNLEAQLRTAAATSRGGSVVASASGAVAPRSPRGPGHPGRVCEAELLPARASVWFPALGRAGRKEGDRRAPGHIRRGPCRSRALPSPRGRDEEHGTSAGRSLTGALPPSQSEWPLGRSAGRMSQCPGSAPATEEGATFENLWSSLYVPSGGPGAGRPRPASSGRLGGQVGQGAAASGLLRRGRGQDRYEDRAPRVATSPGAHPCPGEGHRREAGGGGSCHRSRGAGRTSGP